MREFYGIVTLKHASVKIDSKMAVKGNGMWHSDSIKAEVSIVHAELDDTYPPLHTHTRAYDISPVIDTNR